MSPLLGAFACACFLLPVYAAASTGPDPDLALAGTYSLVPEESDTIAEVIERGTEKMNFIKRPIARRRLRTTNVAYATVRIDLQGEEIATFFDDKPPVRSPADGQPSFFTFEDGEVLQVSAVLENGVLRQTYAARDGQRENVFTLSADGSEMTLAVTLTSHRLPEPISYTLVYRRAE